ncbi:DUF2982 domain-containing protein [Vibrio gangliei]|uniref:DUF2982 domain-containing protein n=1 Tax=Vibrio gangliei TaxID=2077090 RepID=UPI000D0132F5|nr:DUF2982 domain-containing protein [Vibrio gangliei]
MQTKHLFQPQPQISKWLLYLIWALLISLTFYIDSKLNTKVAGLFFISCLLFIIAIKEYVYSQQLGLTLTESHFQQHFYRGGWVLQWSNVRRIGVVEYQIQDWTTSIPWVGIEIKNYQPFIEKMSPKIITKILLHQRGLLYLGLKQHGRQAELEDHILNDKHYVYQDGTTAKGLQAMMANRMALQKQLWGYDIFISENDLTIAKDDLVGIARRYLAASHTGHS